MPTPPINATDPVMPTWIEHHPHSNLGEQIEAWLTQRVRERWNPRSHRAAAAYLRNTIVEPFFLYGAGTHTLELFEQVSFQPLKDLLVGCLDRRAHTGFQDFPCPVFEPSYALKRKEPIVLSHAEFEASMGRDMRALGIHPDRIRSIYDQKEFGQQAFATLARELQPKIQMIPQRDTGQKRVVMVSARARHIVQHDAWQQLERQGDLQLLHISMEPHHLSPMVGQSLVFDAHNCISLCLWLLDQLKPDLIYVNEHYSSGNFLPVVLQRQRKEPVVAEFYDLLGLVFDDPAILARESYWHPQDVQLAVASEAWCGTHSAGIVTKEAGHPFDTYMRDSNHMSFNTYLSRHRFRRHNRVLSDPPRLVWAGTMTPSNLSPIMYGDNQLLDVFQSLKTQPLSITAYTSYATQQAVDAQYPDYRALTAGNLTLHPRIPLEQLLDTMATQHDFGIILGTVKPGSQQNIAFKTTVAGKFFTYLAAGLPILISSYLEVMAEWVATNNLGLVVHPNQMMSLHDLIQAGDYGAWVDSVARYREQWSMERQLPLLRSFLLQAMASR